MISFHFIQKLTLVLYIITVIFLFVYSWWKRKKVSLGSLETTILPLAIILYLVFTLDFPFSHNVPLLISGLTLYIAGSLFGKVAFHSLGWANSDDFWFARFKKEQRHLVTSGPYKYVRHPVFVSIVLSYLGVVLVFLHPISIALWILVSISGVITSFNEEKFMQSKFPEYKEYMRRTGRFFPKMPK